MAGIFDVFLAHNSKAAIQALSLAESLKSKGLKVWIDAWELPPGRAVADVLEEAILSSKTAAILVGEDGIGPWEHVEYRACLDECVRRKLPLIPVLLPGGTKPSSVPLFLRQFSWVDLRLGFTEAGIRQLVWGITGTNDIVETCAALAVRAAEVEVVERMPAMIDAWGMAAIKARLYALSALAAKAAADQAEIAAEHYPSELLNLLIPLVVEIQWRRGFEGMVNRILDVDQGSKANGDFEIKPLSSSAFSSDGTLTATMENVREVLVSIDGRKLARVIAATPLQARMFAVGLSRPGIREQLNGDLVKSVRQVLNALIAEYEAERDWLAKYASLLPVLFAHDGTVDSMAHTASWGDTDNYEAMRSQKSLGLDTTTDDAGDLTLAKAVGLETLGGVFAALLQEGTQLPTVVAEVFSTTEDSQETINLHIMQGRSSQVKDNRSIGHFFLSGIPPGPRGVAQIKVTFSIDEWGVLTVFAKDFLTEQDIQITLAT